MNFEIDAKKIKTRELIEAQTDMDTSLKIMARFMVDPQGLPIPEESAMQILLDTNLEELTQLQNDFLSAFNLKRKNAMR